MKRMTMLLLLVSAMPVGCSQSIESPAPGISGVTQYEFNPNPGEIRPKLHNWVVELSKADSASNRYDIIQVTRPTEDDPAAGQATTTVLIDDRMIVPNPNGTIHFTLHVGDAEPTQNMNAPGNIGHPIIFSGRGTGKGVSNWIVLPGSEIDRVAPTEQGTSLSDGKLRLIQFVVRNADGEKYRAEVILRRR